MASSSPRNQRWKGARFGLDADIADAETGEIMSMRDYVRCMVADATPGAEKLGTSAYLDPIQDVLANGNAANTQRGLLQELGGDLHQLQLRLLEDALEKGIRNPEAIPA